MKIGLLFVALSAGLTLGSGCEVVEVEEDAEESQRPPQAADELAAELEPAGVYAGWTYPTSEERPPANCDPGSMVNQFGCSGGWCDNVRLYCVPTGEVTAGATWTSYFSEEGVSYRVCPLRHWMSGISCRGGWCDNVSIECTYYPNVAEPQVCFWTGWISEEGGGTLAFGPGFYARGAQCSGGYCDNMRFYVCQK